MSRLIRLPRNITKATASQLCTTTRHLSITMAASQETSTKDWSAAQYLKFRDQRTRPSRDLLAQVPIASPKRIVDIGCGPGNSTEVLANKYPDAAINGIDSSPDMIEKAKKALPSAEFAVADLTTYRLEQPADLIFSNAVFQWVSKSDRIPVMKRLIDSLAPGGVFAMQVPDNFNENSHVLMRAVAESGPWAKVLRDLQPSHGQFQQAQELYDALAPLCSSVDIWHTLYQHPLENHQSIVEWFKGTALMPYTDPLSREDKESFLAKYLNLLKEQYPTSVDGRVLLRFPRLFMVAIKK